mgnify:CR=1 FL=1
MKTIVISFFNSLNLLPHYVHYSIRQFSKLGYDPHIMISKHNGVKNSHVAYLNFLDALRLGIQTDCIEDLLICEDDCIIDVSQEDLVPLLDYEKINRVIWNGRSFKCHELEKKGLRLRNGSQAVFVPKEMITNVISHMETNKPRHLDRYWSQGWHPIKYFQGLGGELLHKSGISPHPKLLQHLASYIIEKGEVKRIHNKSRLKECF